MFAPAFEVDNLLAESTLNTGLRVACNRCELIPFELVNEFLQDDDRGTFWHRSHQERKDRAVWAVAGGDGRWTDTWSSGS